MKICLCVGTRPNFMKAAPLIRAFNKYGLKYILVHTGQYYDKNMSGMFFKELGIPEPDISLGAWTAEDSSAQQVGRTIVIFSRQMEIHKPDLIVVLGDMHSTLACAVVANKMGIRLAHVEAGERSNDRSMQEETNRILVDEMSDLLFCASAESHDNLIDRSYPYESEIEPHLVGDTMIDQLVYSKLELDKYAKNIPPDGPYVVLTIHRSGNVDDTERLRAILGIAHKISRRIQIFFPCHPRTQKVMLNNLIPRYTEYRDKLTFLNPMSYIEFMVLVRNARFVMTDSGGLQVETSYLNIPCLTLRENTERHDTITNGTNTLISIDSYINGCDTPIFNNVETILRGNWRQSKFKLNPIHDGKASERIAEIIKKEKL